MTPQRWAFTERYLREVFGKPDEFLEGLMQRAVRAGLPDIAVSPETGRLLMMLVSMTNGGRGAALALELGTLAGYSAIWIARGLAAGGRLITVEPNERHADFARAAFREAGLAERIELRRDWALDALHELAAQFGATFDFIFADAIKTEYGEYFQRSRECLRPGGLFVAHNALGSGSWWIDAADRAESRADRDAVDRFNRSVAADPAFDSMALPIHQGLLIARKRECVGA